ncbi:DUF254-domain-containing protein [Violaceomyces palustris]|uniref:DUF254-domain-containing protein n=1 Tax=Violaceomyces palustris TaxID=1673888 RepID=A0ACD0NV53_9BASI|nr:DUF254-domain-containing protein [Violaceomyces palustris]
MSDGPTDTVREDQSSSHSQERSTLPTSLPSSTTSTSHPTSESTTASSTQALLSTTTTTLSSRRPNGIKSLTSDHHHHQHPTFTSSQESSSRPHHHHFLARSWTTSVKPSTVSSSKVNVESTKSKNSDSNPSSSRPSTADNSGATSRATSPKITAVNATSSPYPTFPASQTGGAGGSGTSTPVFGIQTPSEHDPDTIKARDDRRKDQGTGLKRVLAPDQTGSMGTSEKRESSLFLDHDRTEEEKLSDGTSMAFDTMTEEEESLKKGIDEGLGIATTTELEDKLPDQDAGVGATGDGGGIGSALSFVRSVSHRQDLSGSIASLESLREGKASTGSVMSAGKGKERERAVIDPEKEGEPQMESRKLNTGEERRQGEEEREGEQVKVEDRYPERRYYVLSSAGKPIYISHLASSRVQRIARFKRRMESDDSRTRERSDSVSTTGDWSRSLTEEEAQDIERERRELQELEDEEEELATTQVGVMQALISIFADEDNDKIRHIETDGGRTRITFLLRAPLYLVCVSSWGEPINACRNHLEYLYLQILSIVSAGQLNRLFTRMPNFDLRRLLEGTERLLGNLLSKLQTDLSFPLGALHPLRMEKSLRDNLANALHPPGRDADGSEGERKRPKDLLYVMLLHKERIITLLRPRRHSVHPSDMHLLINTVYSNRELREPGSESWIPICLPRFAPQGFLHAYVSFLKSSREKGEDEGEGKEDDELVGGEVGGGKGQARTDDEDSQLPTSSSSSSNDDDEDDGSLGTDERESGNQGGERRKSHPKKRKEESHLSLVMVTGNREGFKELSEWSRTIVQTLRRTKLLSRLEDSIRLASHHYSADDLHIPGLRHFIYKSRTNVQITSPRYEPPYSDQSGYSNDRKRLTTLYQIVHDSISSPQPNSSSIFPTSLLGGSTNKEPWQQELLLYSEIKKLSSSSSSTNNNRSRDQKGFPPIPTPVKMQYLRTDKEAVLGWITQPFELYMTVNPWLPKTAIVAAANSVAAWVRKEEENLFLLNSPVF